MPRESRSAACSDRRVRLVGHNALVTDHAAIEAEINGQPRSLRLARGLVDAAAGCHPAAAAAQGGTVPARLPRGRTCGPRFTISLKRSTLIFSYPSWQADYPIFEGRSRHGLRDGMRCRQRPA
jgi:hypothetical protein